VIKKHISWVSFGLEIGGTIENTLEKARKLSYQERDKFFGTKIHKLHEDLDRDGLPLVGESSDLSIYASSHDERLKNLQTARANAISYSEFLPFLVNGSIEIQAT